MLPYQIPSLVHFPLKFQDRSCSFDRLLKIMKFLGNVFYHYLFCANISSFLMKLQPCPLLEYALMHANIGVRSFALSMCLSKHFVTVMRGIYSDYQFKLLIKPSMLGEKQFVQLGRSHHFIYQAELNSKDIREEQLAALGIQDELDKTAQVLLDTSQDLHSSAS